MTRAGWRSCKASAIRIRTARISARRRFGRRPVIRGGSSTTAGWGDTSTTPAPAAIRRSGSTLAGRCRRLSPRKHPTGVSLDNPQNYRFGARSRIPGQDQEHDGGILPQAERAGRRKQRENSGGTIAAIDSAASATSEANCSDGAVWLKIAANCFCPIRSTAGAVPPAAADRRRTRSIPLGQCPRKLRTGRPPAKRRAPSEARTRPSPTARRGNRPGDVRATARPGPSPRGPAGDTPAPLSD